MNRLFSLISLIFFVAFTGCMEIESRIILQVDGSAIIKETVRIHKELLDFTDNEGKSLVMPYLEKSACEERAKLFGEGTVLTSHAIKNLNGGVKVLEAEYKIPDINNLYVINPYLGYTNYKEMGRAKLSFKPQFKSDAYSGAHAGEMGLVVVTEKPGAGQPRIQKGEPNLKMPSPVILQKYRNLQPIFKDLMKEFKVTVSFQCYASLHTCFGLRNVSAKPRSCELFSFSGADYDNTGGMLLDNDEIMHELLRQKFWDKNFARAVQDFPNNATVPVVSDSGSPYAGYKNSAAVGMYFPPTKAMFDKYFVGKKLDYSQWAPSKPEACVDALFEKIGFDPDKDTMKAALKAAPKVEEVAKPAEPAK